MKRIRNEKITIKQFLFIFLPLLILWTPAFGKSSDLQSNDDGNISHQITDDIKTVGLIAIVRLSEAEIDGNFPITAEGARVKEEVDIKKKVYTRYDLKLRGEIIRILKGVTSKNELEFNILMENLIADRNHFALDDPASNIPELIIGKKYVV